MVLLVGIILSVGKPFVRIEKLTQFTHNKVSKISRKTNTDQSAMYKIPVQSIIDFLHIHLDTYITFLTSSGFIQVIENPIGHHSILNDKSYKLKALWFSLIIVGSISLIILVIVFVMIFIIKLQSAICLKSVV